MTSRSKNLCEQAVTDLVKYTERFEQEGLTGIWYAILDVTTTVVGDTIKRKKMPLTKKGAKIREAMQKFYGKDKGEEVFYATVNKGKIKGAEKKKKQ